MPYIQFDRREAALDGDVQTPGELNFVLTSFVKAYMNHKQLSYQTINDIVGALEGAKLEFYRRVVIPYETQKAHDNGDVYT